MSKSKAMNGLTRTFNKSLVKIKKYSPEILLVTGIVGGVTSAVMACRATTKASALVEKSKEKIATIHQVANDPKYAEEYTPEDKKKDLAIAYVQTGLDFVKLYGPSVLLGAVSIGCILASHNIIRKRNIALATAYQLSTNALKEYKKRVGERFGEDVVRELTYNVKTKAVDEVVVNEDGTESVVTSNVEVAEGPVLSPYAICFDETCMHWTRNAEDNKFFLLQIQNWANDRLRTEGVLFLNEVREAIGLPKTQVGQMVGWVYDKNSEFGDGYVDLGIYDISKKDNRAFINGVEKCVWLEPNVDGVIYDLLK